MMLETIWGKEGGLRLMSLRNSKEKLLTKEDDVEKRWNERRSWREVQGERLVCVVRKIKSEKHQESMVW